MKRIGLTTKLATAFDVMVQIEKAKTEDEAILQTLTCLKRLGYPNVMVSFLKTVDGEPMLVPDPTLSVGEKWRGIARYTVRQYEPSEDLIPIVLRQKQPRFVLDSRNDPDIDQELWRRFGLVSQYVVPLATDSLRIGVMQVDMGTVSEKPEVECKMLDALAAHLSLAIERHRGFLEIEKLNSQLVSEAKLVAFDAAAATIMHELMHSVGDYAAALRDALSKPSIRSNKDAFEFLKHTERRVLNWVSSLTANVRQFRQNEIVEPFDVETLLKELIAMWHPKAALRGCTLTLRCQTRMALL